MPAPIRRKNSTVIEQLEKQPARFPFFQAVRLLERASIFGNRQKQKPRQSDNPVGHFTPPYTEGIQFKDHLSLGFPASEITSVTPAEANKPQGRWQLATDFIGLTGAIGVLPFHYTELLFKRLKLKDSAFRHFLSLFHHRTVSLFFRAGIKYRLPLVYERHQLHNRRQHDIDAHTFALRSLIGLGNNALTEGLRIPADTLVYYSGFLSQSIRTTSALEQTLSHYFDIPVAIQEFVGEWHDLIDDVRSKLPSPGFPNGQNAQLGRSAILGGKGWFGQGKIRVKLGPLDDIQFNRFRPGTSALLELNHMVKLFTGAEVESEYVMHVAREHIPHRIQLNNTEPAIIGWDTWLATKPLAEDRKGETLEITVSSNRLN